ncbi:Uncharacterised protein [Mycobacteroides abscessus subsp. abscessus]|uniref:hypothetical protein n=1 Tax=Mycobacteroides abscessus TaxID=36809 RepID=UPI000928A486|nr:hypothetical protein [Mycobacteroides abscessus]MBN7378412.1 hypothetical protein [Mycobacteroides abscessus subsp. massiliense]SHX33373.1 Uncharacterised protein [Mycobacteroides abscessus subsp. abscessus]SHX51183.1 Uncharacterised protein [Mycobacteroides abscessus subsp. abscessus]SIB70178.1 Uncharacterised protein [Mycobacteroides abscessus subsp. abscessus]SKV77070.1 Uncharacterised protein [Mycobacteroides abscessus subsp. abscessus]
MIEIWGARYAAGKNVATTMRIIYWLTAAQYAILVAAFILLAVFNDGPAYKAGTFMFLGFFILILITSAATGVLAIILESAEKQPVEEPPSTAWEIIKSPSPMNLMPVAMLLPMLAAASWLIGDWVFRRVHWPAIAIVVLILAVVVVTGSLHVRCLRRVWRRMDGEVKKGADLFRDFDWSLIEADDKARFREKYPNKYWKYPQDASCDAEITCFIRRARGLHSRMQLLSAIISLVIALAITELFKRTVSAWVQIAGHNGSTPVAMGVTFALFAIIMFFLLPFYLQRRATRYDELRKDYEKYLEKSAKDKIEDSAAGG